jgi:hypothetical protein
MRLSGAYVVEMTGKVWEEESNVGRVKKVRLARP